MAVTAIKVRKGLYELRGVTHGTKFLGKPPCGGQVFAEWFPAQADSESFDGKEVPYTIPPSWECYCERCGDCDTNGWPTLRDCVREATNYWGNR